MALMGCGSETPGTRSVVATVDGRAIMEGEFQEAFDRRKAVLDESLLAKPDVQEALKRRVLEELIARRLLLQEADRRGVSPPPEAVEQRLAELSQGYTPNDYEAMLKEQGLSPEFFRARVTEDLTIELLMEKALGEPKTPKPAEVEAYYQEHVSEMHRPVRARALHLVVTTAEEAGKLRESVLKGADFAELARRHSIGPEAVKDGELGWRSPGEMPEAFDEAIFALQPGQVSPVVSSPYGFHLFKLLEVRESGVPSLEEARPAIIARLKNEAREAQQRLWLEGLQAKADIVVHGTAQEARR
jgi:parvulin-like peptidyl-prolyl isomerase